MTNGVELATAWVRIVPSVEGIQGAIASELGPVESEAEKTGKAAGNKLSTGFKAGITLASAFILREVVGLAKDTVESLARIETTNAATTQAIEATGGAANVSAEHVEALAGSLESLTATEAETIQAGANTLLTFKNIANQAGEGNDVFDQTIKTLVDMSRVQGSVEQNSLLLGKALNDPVGGMAALTRVGVQFTDQQKEQIAALAESGDLMGAQKLILGELNSQFGGQGEAYAATYAGQMELLDHSMGTAAETMMSAFMPALQDITVAATGFFNFLAENPDLLNALAIAIGVVTVAIIAANVAMWAMAANPIVLLIMAIVVAVGLLIAGIVLLVQNWDAVVAWGLEVWNGFVGWLVGLIEGFAGWWDGVWSGIVGFFQDAFNNILNFWLGFPLVGDIIRAIQFVATNWDKIWASVAKTFENIWKGIGDFFRGVANWILRGVQSFVNGAVDLINGIIGPINAVSAAIGDAIGQTWRVPLLPHISIPMLADGGTLLTSGSVLVGERGPEILSLPAGATVEPLDDSQSESGRTVRFDRRDLDELAGILASMLRLEMRRA